MNYWEMTEQLPIVVYIVLTRQKRQVDALETKFIFLTKPKLGDYVTIKFQTTEINIASKEQTILDGLSMPQYCLGLSEMAKAIMSTKDKLDWNKLNLLAKNDKSVVRRRLGYILDLLKLKKYSTALKEKFIGFNWLDHSREKKVLGYSKKWGLKLNCTEADLLAFREGF